MTKPSQEPRRDLQGFASDVKWSAVELIRIAERLRQAGNEALAIGMKGVTPTTLGYPERALRQITQVLEAIEAALIEIGELNGASNSSPFTELHRPCRA